MYAMVGTRLDIGYSIRGVDHKFLSNPGNEYWNGVEINMNWNHHLSFSETRNLNRQLLYVFSKRYIWIKNVF